MDIADKKLWEAIVIALFLLFVALAASGGIALAFCYLAPEPAECIEAFNPAVSIASAVFGLIVFVLTLWLMLKKK